MAPRNGHCDLLEFEDQHPEHFEAGNIVTLPQADILRILTGYVDQLRANDARDRTVLRRLGKISPSVASKFTLKTTILPQLKFRLITKQKCQPNEVPSFVALSYCWPVQPPQGLRTSAEPEVSGLRLPVSATLSKAVACELQSDAEGLWCDQLCISQADPSEMTVSVGLMDGIYHSARLVIMLLDDIEINEEEAEFLNWYGPEFASRPKRTEGQTPPFMVIHAVIASLYLKIIGSQWFERAWCSHELCMSRAYVVLARCSGPRTTILRLSQDFMSHMLNLWLEIRNQVPRTLSSQTIGGATGTISTPGKGWKNSVLRVWTNLTFLKAGGVRLLGPALRQQSAMQDKFVICLNVSASGLGVNESAYQEATTRLLPGDEWLYRLTALTFAQSYPTVLCTSGNFISVPSRDSRKSWIQVPTSTDTFLGVDETFGLMEDKCRFDADEFGRYIQLPVALASHGWELHEPSHVFTSVAMTIMEICQQLESEIEEVPFWASKQHNFWIHQDSKRLTAQFLGCVLACGVPWVVQTLVQQHRFFHSRERIIADRYLSLFSTKRETFLNIDCFETSAEITGGAYKAELTSWILSSIDNHKMMEYLLHMTYFMLFISLPEAWEFGDLRRYSTYIARSAAHAPVLLVMPDEYKSSTIAVPAELTDDGFTRLKRAWVLNECEDKTALHGTDHASFHLQGKMRLFGPSLSTLSSQTSMARVYGPKCVHEEH